MVGHNSWLVAIACALHLTCVFLLSICYSKSTIHPIANDARIKTVQIWTISLGLAAGLFTICLPYTLNIDNPLVECTLRVVCFFYGSKILDLGVARARKPPTLLEAGLPKALDSFSSRVEYAWLLLSQTRYSAFDIAVQQRERAKDTSNAWTLVPPLVVPLLVYLVPSPETKSLMALLVIQLGLEGLHALLHPACPNYLFWQPFAASSLTAFWRTHWHGGAETFLRSLGYAPGKGSADRLGLNPRLGRALGVIAAFNWTGIWHGWATAALATQPWGVGLRVWSLFVVMGLGVILEALMPGNLRGSLPHRIFVWLSIIFWAGWAWRGLQSNCKVQWLAEL